MLMVSKCNGVGRTYPAGAKDRNMTLVRVGDPPGDAAGRRCGKRYDGLAADIGLRQNVAVGRTQLDPAVGAHPDGRVGANRKLAGSAAGGRAASSTAGVPPPAAAAEAAVVATRGCSAGAGGWAACAWPGPGRFITTGGGGGGGRRRRPAERVACPAAAVAAAERPLHGAPARLRAAGCRAPGASPGSAAPVAPLWPERRSVAAGGWASVDGAGLG